MKKQSEKFTQESLNDQLAQLALAMNKEKKGNKSNDVKKDIVKKAKIDAAESNQSQKIERKTEIKNSTSNKTEKKIEEKTQSKNSNDINKPVWMNSVPKEAFERSEAEKEENFASKEMEVIEPIMNEPLEEIPQEAFRYASVPEPIGDDELKPKPSQELKVHSGIGKEITEEEFEEYKKKKKNSPRATIIIKTRTVTQDGDTISQGNGFKEFKPTRREDVVIEDKDKSFYLIRTDTGEIYDLSKSSISIGKSDSANIVLKERYISRSHARIYKRSEQLFISDLGSTNGTFVNGKKIDTSNYEIHEGDEIRLADINFNLMSKL